MFEILGISLVCLIVADFFTGLFHWGEDTYCKDGYPIIGKLICEPNIDHHLDPTLMVRTGNFISRNLISWVLSFAAYIVMWWFDLHYWWVCLTLFFTAFGNEVHRWNHANRPGWFAQFMKDAGIVQAERQHRLHHKPPFMSHYCVLTSFTNAVLERIRFWRGLEWLISTVFRVHPKREYRRDWNMGRPA